MTTTYDELEGYGPTPAQLAFEEAMNDLYGFDEAARILADEF